MAILLLFLLLLLLPPDEDRVLSKRYKMISWGWRRYCMIAVGKIQINTAVVDRDIHELCAQYAGIRVVFRMPFRVDGDDINLPRIHSTLAWLSSALYAR